MHVSVGYTPIFIDRQMLIQILYDNLKDNSKILTRKGVEKVTDISSGVRVVTQDGDIFTGEILVGADGIHSRTRSEMWRIADLETPGYFPSKERTEVPTEYACIFGISKTTSKFPAQSSQNVQGNNASYLLATGPKGRMYWFLFKKLDKIFHGLDGNIPRYTDAERDALAEQHANDLLIDSTGLTFGDLYETRISATLQALPEFVFSKWYYRRIFTIGDAVHKFNPIGGQGGNSAIEDAAVLANHIHNLVRTEDGHSNLTDENIKFAFASTQAKRFARAVKFVKASHDSQSLQAKDTLKSKLIANYLIPRAGPEQIFSMLTSQSLGAAKLEMFDVPEKPHSELWFDERPARPLTDDASNRGRLAASTAFVACIVWLAQTTRVHLAGPLTKTFVSLEPGANFTKNEDVDGVLKSVALKFAGTVSWTDISHSLQGLNLIFLLAPLLLVWHMEAYRGGSKSSFVARYAHVSPIHLQIN